MKDFLNTINIRLNNPFILSFCISWIFWNWPIVIGLIWYNSSNINTFDNNYESYQDLIYQNANIWRNYIYPASFAIAYPVLKWGFNIIQTWVGTKEEKSIKVVSGKGYIPTSKYIEVVSSYDEQIKTLSQIIENEGETETKLSKTTVDLIEANKKIPDLEANIAISVKKEEQWRRYSNIDFAFDGKWFIKIESGDDGTIWVGTFDIKNGVGYDSDNFNYYGDQKIALVFNFYVYSPLSEKVAVGFQEKERLETYIFHEASWNEDYSILIGEDVYSISNRKFEMKRINNAS